MQFMAEYRNLDGPAFRRSSEKPWGWDVVVELDGHEIRIRTVEDVVSDGQALTPALLAGKPKASVEALLADRKWQEIAPAAGVKRSPTTSAASAQTAPVMPVSGIGHLQICTIRRVTDDAIRKSR